MDGILSKGCENVIGTDAFELPKEEKMRVWGAGSAVLIVWIEGRPVRWPGVVIPPYCFVLRGW